MIKNITTRDETRSTRARRVNPLSLPDTSASLANMELAAYEDADFALTEALETDPVVMRGLGGPTERSRLRESHQRRVADPWYFKIVPVPAGAGAGTIRIWVPSTGSSTFHCSASVTSPTRDGR